MEKKFLHKFHYLLLVAIMSGSFSGHAFADTFEKGDAIYRNITYTDIAVTADFNIITAIAYLAGHAGIYAEWDQNSDRVMAPAYHTIIHMQGGGYSETNLEDFQSFGWWGGRTIVGLSYEKRKDIISNARTKYKAKYQFLEYYKNPYGVPGVNDGNPTFRCDGLVEWLYESVGVDLVNDSSWYTITPSLQMASSSFSSSSGSMGSVSFTDTSGLSAYASDGEYGSGVALVDIYIDGEKYTDNTPENMEGIYSITYDPELCAEKKTANIYAVAYDQAGNSISTTPMDVEFDGVVIDDGDACTVDSCDPATGTVSHDPVDIDDNKACTYDSCDSATGVISHEPWDIDDLNPCTIDSCDPATGIVSSFASKSILR